MAPSPVNLWPFRKRLGAVTFSIAAGGCAFSGRGFPRWIQERPLDVRHDGNIANNGPHGNFRLTGRFPAPVLILALAGGRRKGRRRRMDVSRMRFPRRCDGRDAEVAVKLFERETPIVLMGVSLPPAPVLP